MNNIKVLYYDNTIDSTAAFEERLRRICTSVYSIKTGIDMVNFNGTSQDLFNQVSDENDRFHLFIVDIDPARDSYWGYMNHGLWEWLSANPSSEQ